MATERITEKPNLSPVLGELEEDRGEALTEQLAGADERLAKLAETLNERGGVGFATEGVVLEKEWSGQALIKMMVENEKRNVGFAAELRPQNFFGDEDNPWQPGRPPMVMSTDAWDVAGEVSVRFKTRVAGTALHDPGAGRSSSARSATRRPRKRSRRSSLPATS